MDTQPTGLSLIRCDDETTSAGVAPQDRDLYELARARIAHDDGRRYTIDETFGADYHPVDDGYEPEFE